MSGGEGVKQLSSDLIEGECGRQRIEIQTVVGTRISPPDKDALTLVQCFYGLTSDQLIKLALI